MAVMLYAATALSLVLAYGLGVIEQRFFTSAVSVVALSAGLLAFLRVESFLRDYRRNLKEHQRSAKQTKQVRVELNHVRRKLDALESVERKRHAEQLGAVEKSTARLEREFGLVDRKFRAVERTVRDTYAQTEAFVDLRALISPRAPLPPLVSWAVSADALRPMIEWILRAEPKVIVECGSGSSSVWMGYVAERTGATIIALEHDPRYAEASRALVEAHGLSEVVDVRLAPLQEWRSGDETWQWYSLDALEDLTEIGLLFIDGPPGATGPLARYPALPLLLPRCADQVAIFLDDTGREQESAVSDRWAAEFPELIRSDHRRNKGLDVFVRSSA
ncbi:class I SAM-dependent methyltransferase [Planomonospora sp. ID67723]|uniref:class I SAM-dependent methyltransferase n=1 Tax=Planomonospora sp. ID67723 TaxID=2738134 RepID=UPI0018C36788|nr:class I SAM-dependent methyltransferase [Planomonospora sp. ID67723]MBG0827864.1 class I SAM-dependent methyltransferase [Planomonospora sp. ID67723]